MRIKDCGLTNAATTVQRHQLTVHDGHDVDALADVDDNARRGVVGEQAQHRLVRQIHRRRAERFEHDAHQLGLRLCVQPARYIHLPVQRWTW